MDIHEYLLKKKNIQNAILAFIEDEEKDEENYQNLVKMVNENNISKDPNEFRSFLHLIDNISNNHIRTKNFWVKFEKIILLLKNEFGKFLTNAEIFIIFKKNKRILRFLLDNNLLQIDRFITNSIQQFKGKKYPDYLISQLEPKEPTFKSQNDSLKNTEQYIKEGENELTYCDIIRRDSISEFIAFVEKTNLSLNTEISISIYETNSILILKNPSLIEYSAFFGSIQIFRYLQKNDVALTPSLWICAIHGFNPEIIHILENEKILPEDQTYKSCLKESIKCHHNDIVNYIKDNYFENKLGIDDFICQQSIQYYNYAFFPNDLFNRITFFYFCRFDYFFFVDFILKNKKFNINVEINDKIKSYSYILTPLVISVMNDNKAIAELLLSQPEIDVNHKMIKCKWSHKEVSSNVLFFAIQNNNQELIKSLLMNSEINVNSMKIIKEHKNNLSTVVNTTFPLLEAILHEQTEVVKILLNHHNVDVNLERVVAIISSNDSIIQIKTNSLYEAVKIGNIEIIKLLLSNPKIDINMINIHNNNYNLIETRETALNMAFKKDNLEIIKLLLSNPNIDANVISTVIKDKIESKETALNLAIKRNYLEIIDLLLSNPNIDINMITHVHSNNTEIKETALSVAIKTQNKQIVDLLLLNPNLDVNLLITETIYGIEYCETPLLLAIRTKDFEIVCSLLSHKNINVNMRGTETTIKSKAKTEMSALISAIRFNLIDIVQLLLSYPGIDLNDECISGDKNGSFRKSALTIAIEKKYTNIIQLLLQYQDIDVNYKYYRSLNFNEVIEEISVLHLAIIYNEIDTVKLLLSNNAIDVNIKSSTTKSNKDFIEKTEKTTLDYAIQSENIEILQLLLSNKKIDVGLKSTRSMFTPNSFFSEEKTPLQLSFAKGNAKSFSILFEYLQHNGKLVNENLIELMNMTNDDKIKSIIYNYINYQK